MWWYLLLLPAAAALWLLYEWMEHTWVQYNTTVVDSCGLPKKEELRLCLISDLHNNRKNLKKLMHHIRKFAPDFVLLAGDMVDKHKSENIHAEQFLCALEQLHLPVYYSAGNHELSFWENNPQAWEQYVKKLPKGVTFLDNQSMRIKTKPSGLAICVSGLSLSREFYKKGPLYMDSKNLPDFPIPENNFHILLAHHPEYAFMYEKYDVDFIVSGHLHGGLLRLPLIGGVVSPRLRLPDGCDAGLVPLSGKSQMFVSRGLGSHTIPLRFFNRVEVNFLVLKGTKEK